jgi:hypothetical protein
MSNRYINNAHHWKEYWLLRMGRKTMLVLALALIGSVSTTTQAQRIHIPAQRNHIEAVKIANESRNSVTFDVVYNYTGEQGDKVFMSIVMSHNGQTSNYFAFKPGRIRKGRHSTRVYLGVVKSAPDIFLTNQIQLALYVGGENHLSNEIIYFIRLGVVLAASFHRFCGLLEAQNLRRKFQVRLSLAQALIRKLLVGMHQYAVSRQTVVSSCTIQMGRFVEYLQAV